MSNSLDHHTHPMVRKQKQSKLRSRLMLWCLIGSSFCTTFGAGAAVIGVTQCSGTNFTIQLQGFPNATIAAQLMLVPTGEIILNTTYNFSNQTLVAVRPANLVGGNYVANFYVNGAWFTQASLNICNLFGGPVAGQTNIYPAIFSALCVSTNSSGLVHDKVITSELIRDCAAEHGVTNTRNLRLVYNRAEDALQVVGSTNQFNTNQMVLCTVLSFENSMSFTNTNGTSIQRLAFVFVETNQVASGTLVARERLSYGKANTNQLTGYRLLGQLAYTIPAVGTNASQICQAILIAGTGDLIRDGDRDDDDDDDDDDEDDHDDHNDDHPGNGNGHDNGHKKGNGNHK